MKRTPLKRGKPLKRSGGLKRSEMPKRTKRLRHGGYIRRNTQLTHVNEERKAKRYELDFGELADFVRVMPCCACPRPAPSDPAHVKSRGSGGHAFNDDGTGNIIPLCRICHNEQHAKGWSAIFDGGQVEAKLAAQAIGVMFTGEGESE